MPLDGQLSQSGSRSSLRVIVQVWIVIKECSFEADTIGNFILIKWALDSNGRFHDSFRDDNKQIQVHDVRFRQEREEKERVIAESGLEAYLDILGGRDEGSTTIQRDSESRAARIDAALALRCADRQQWPTTQTHTDSVNKQIKDISTEEQVDKEEYYDEMLGKKWLETAQERLENLGRVEISANQEPDETLAVDHDRAGTPDDGELLRDPGADYVPGNGE
ncbi:hypothetical protein PV08_06378 [Exophiala spinifera]|uniref:Uncharacterized protein n=1 Tax=Exophiala spinifera TaxID=91928 RepID=A0A0D1ZU57_9EURO|nr:uncharacterized protein PV08_06378 [Exophiala spinifera]KIW16327.1 hypothetical protein PV08_06378 [Exophiala spinifera]